MSSPWLWLLATGLLASHMAAERGGSSLRGALEALQRRQRARIPPPVMPQPDYDAVYEFFPPDAYADPDYGIDSEDMSNEPDSRYIIKLLDENDGRPEEYEYKLIKKKNANYATVGALPNKESAFRERSQQSNDKLRHLFMDNNETEEKISMQETPDNDAEYAKLLSRLWSKYKNNKSKNTVSAPQGILKLYKDKTVKKRVPDNWGPIAFKKKRNTNSEHPILLEYDGKDEPTELLSRESTYNKYKTAENDKDDIREEYAIAFQPLDDESVSEIIDDDQYSFSEKRFPVSKRSSDLSELDIKNNNLIQNQSKRDTAKRFRSSAGTDPKIIKDLSKIFGDSDIQFIKTPVKRSSDNVENPQEILPPNLTTMHFNVSVDNNKTTKNNDDSHEQHAHNMHHPGTVGEEVDHAHENHHAKTEKPIVIKKKSIDWSNYFGIDKRKKKSVFNTTSPEKIRTQYFDFFNGQVIYPLTSYPNHSKVKRDYVSSKANQESDIQKISAQIARSDDLRTNDDNDSKLDNIDRKLRTMEGIIVDEALHYPNIGEELDSKEEQETKEKLLARLAAAYSLEKMRNALNEFKQSLRIQKNNPSLKSTTSSEMKNKRVAVKKEKVEVQGNDISYYDKGKQKIEDIQDEQGAGHYLNGKIEDQFSEGYMGGSGRYHSPVSASLMRTTGTCPILSRIVQRCHGVDMLAGDRGQLFLPLCSLHQICYLCGSAPATTCDLVFLSEADTTCDGDMSCQRVARAALMALRELHDNLSDEMDGECEANPCLAATLKLHTGWERALKR